MIIKSRIEYRKVDQSLTFRRLDNLAISLSFELEPAKMQTIPGCVTIHLTIIGIKNQAIELAIPLTKYLLKHLSPF